MSQWGKRDLPNGNNKPKHANTSNTFGVSTTEMNNAASIDVPHAGWVSVKRGLGPITSVSITNGGAGYTANGFLEITDANGGGGANVAYTVNAANAIVSTSVIAGGLYANASGLTIAANASNSGIASFTATLGGRSGRYSTEVLVAMSSITDDASNTFFVGV